MDIDTRTLRTFWGVVGAGSFTKAAQRLGYSQSSVTMQIRTLERIVGEPVFIRSSNGVRLTPAGETVWEYAKQLLSLVDNLEDELQRTADPFPRIRLGVVPALACGKLLSRLTHAGQALLKHVGLDLRVVVSHDIPAALREKRLDAAIGLASAERRCAAGGAEAGAAVAEEREPYSDRDSRIVLGGLKFAAVAPSPGRGGGAASQYVRPITAPVLVADPGCPSQRWLPEYLRMRDGRPAESRELATLDGIRESVRTGLGCAMLPVGLFGAAERDSLVPMSGVPVMRWNAVLQSDPARPFGDLHRRALVDTVQLALQPTAAAGLAFTLLGGARA
ncbi:LysR family transcriptional regulator [Kitasatospora sp. NPDC004272]